MKCTAGFELILHEYLDGRLNGVEMSRVSAHVRECRACAKNLQQLSKAQTMLSALGQPKAPIELQTRIKQAISVERARRAETFGARAARVWDETFGAFALRLAGGFASAVLLMGSVAVMVGMFVQPELVRADDEPLGMRTSPRLLYVSNVVTQHQIDELPSISVEVAVDPNGRAYDYRIVSGPDDVETRRAIENLLLFSTFTPARYYGQPVQGLAILNFNGVDVKG